LGSKLILITAAVMVTAALAAGVSYATVPDSTGVIHACYKVDPNGNPDNNAALRIIHPAVVSTPDSTACKKNEQALDWNVRGVAGPQGPRGPSGPQGPSGPSGPAGSGG
jgi:hypothetical protein